MFAFEVYEVLVSPFFQPLEVLLNSRHAVYGESADPHPLFGVVCKLAEGELHQIIQAVSNDGKQYWPQHN